jgi:isopentenyl diphosphate isomerase/L-lactate dehydrogenase-like FMN-dependent dehydrogenase
MAGPSYEYVAGGSAQDVTLAANLAAFAGWSIYPRLLADVSAGHLGLTLAGQPLSNPVLLAPVAFQKLAHPLGELETARAAQAVQSCLVTSTLSSCTLEDVARAAGPGHWFQLYFQPTREATLDLLARAEAAGYKAIVVTLDAPLQVPSMRALQAQFRMPADCAPANLRNYDALPPPEPGPGQSRIFQGAMRAAPTWRDLQWLMTQTTLPVWIKGVAHPSDACAMRDAGAAGVIVSNHGGRGLDGAPASLAMLPAVRAALGPEYPVLFDGGIRSGSDIFKALALGANAVLVGRLQMYALSVAGALGVAHMVRLLLEELEICMALAGCASVAQVDRATLYRHRDEGMGC